MSTADQASRLVLWCRWCGQPARHWGSVGPPGKAVHADTGEALCADGEHAAVLTNVTPAAVGAEPGMAGLPEQGMVAEIDDTATARFMWLWASGRRSGVTDDEQRARANAEQAAVDGGWKAHVELVRIGLGMHLEPVYVPTGIRYDGITLGGQVAWALQAPAVMA